MKTFTLSLFLILCLTSSIYAQWIQRGLDIDGEASEDESGWSASINGNGTILAIGASLNDQTGINAGHARVFQWSGSNWTQLGSDLNGESAYDLFGISVCLNDSGDVLAVGGYYNDGNGIESGHVRVFDYNGSSWIKRGTDIDGETADDRSGYSVSLNSDGDIVAIGAQYNDGNGTSSGHVRVFQWSGSSWTQLGNDIEGEASADYSGSSVSMNDTGNILAIGAIYNDGNGTDAGHVRVFQYSGGNWIQLGSDIDGEETNDIFGWSVSLNSDGKIVAVGAPGNDGNGADAGHARVFEYSGGNWIQLGSDIESEATGDFLGRSISLNSDGTIVAIGADENDGNGSNSGHIRVFQWSGSSWTQVNGDMDGEAINDHSGYSVSLSNDGSVVAVGAFLNDGNGTSSGHVRVYENPVLSVDKSRLIPEILIYPNPTSDKIMIKTDNLLNVKITDIQGIELMSSNENIIDLSTLSKGLYLVKITTDYGVFVSRVVLK